MTTRTQLKRTLITAAVAGFIAAPSAQALDFELNEDWKGYVDNTLKTGIMWRVADRDQNIVGIANGGTSFSTNSDDGNLNYDRGDTVFETAKLVTEFGLRNEWMNIYARTSYLYDWRNRNNRDLHPEVRDKIGAEAELLDLYVDFDFDVGTTRIGKQVVNWGDSNFFQYSINVINPLNVSALRIPGSTIRDAKIPVNLWYSTLDLSDTTTLQAFYQLDWEKTEPDMAGTYFSTNDFATRGGGFAFTGFGAHEFNPYRGVNVGSGAAAAGGRASDNEAKDTGQYGIALKYQSQLFDSTEFGFYHMNYHSRLPLISGYQGFIPTGAVPPAAPFSARYQIEYPEDIKLYGLSVTTELFGWSVAGELSYRTDVPLQLDDVDLLYAGVGLGGVVPGSQIQAPVPGGACGVGPADPNCYIRGFRRHEMAFLSTTFIKTFNGVFGADTTVFLLEPGVQYIPTLESKSELRYDGPGTTTSGAPAAGTANPRQQRNGFADDFSWGYRMLMKFKYAKAFGNWDFTPRVIWFHDVQGTSPGPGGSFIEDRRTFGLGAEMAYDDFTFDIFYANYFGAGEHNLINDRDFISISAKYAF